MLPRADPEPPYNQAKICKTDGITGLWMDLVFFGTMANTATNPGFYMWTEMATEVANWLWGPDETTHSLVYTACTQAVSGAGQ